MATKKDYTFLAIMGAAAAYLVYDTFIKKHNASEQLPVAPGAPVNPARSITPSGSTYSYPIVYEQYHPDVKRLQAIVDTDQDGIIGPITLTAIQNWVPSFTEDSKINSFDDLVQLGYNIVEARYNG